MKNIIDWFYLLTFAYLIFQILIMTQKQIDHYVYSTASVLGEGSTGTVYLGRISFI